MATYRHGDIILKELSAKEAANTPTTAKGWKKFDEYVVAEGEVTGHAHRLKGAGQVALFPGGKTIIDLANEAILDHEEHGAIAIKPGKYKVVHERELDYDRDEAYAVAD